MSGSATTSSSPAAASTAASSATGGSAGTSATSAGACSAATSPLRSLLDRRSLLGDLLDDLLGLGGRLGGRFLDCFGDYSFGFFLRLSRRLFGRRVGGGFSVGGLLGTFLDALLGLLARLRLLRIVARRPLADAGGVEEAQDAVGRLRADAQPMLAIRSESSFTRSGESFASSGL